MAPAFRTCWASTAGPRSIENRIQPIEVAGLKVISMGFLVPPGEAVVWRGPMLHGAITQFLRDTAWGELDYLIIDMPPGTGDIALDACRNCCRCPARSWFARRRTWRCWTRSRPWPCSAR